MRTAAGARSLSGQLGGADAPDATHSPTSAALHAQHHGRILLETFSTFFLGGYGKLRARLRTDAVYLHVGAQGCGLVHGHDAEQRSGGGPEDHGHATAGDRSAAKGDHHEPKGNNQGTDLEVEPLREPELPGGGGTWRQAAGVDEHDGGRVPGHHGHSGPVGTDFTDAQTEAGESRGREAVAREADRSKVNSITCGGC